LYSALLSFIIIREKTSRDFSEVLTMVMDIKQVASQIAPNKLFESLAYAVIRAAEKLTISTNDKEKLLNHTDIFSAINVLPNNTKLNFIKWFHELKKIDIEQYKSCVNLFQSPEDLINGLGERIFSPEEAKLKGAVFTPSWLATEIIRKAFRFWKQYNNGKGEPSLVGDLSCGPGIFIHHLLETTSKQTRITGVDICPEYVALARLLTIPSTNEHRVQIDCFDTLLDTQIDLFSNEDTSKVPSEGYDLIVGNPPYVRSQLLDPSYSSLLKQFFPEYTRGNFDLTVLFLLHTIRALAPGGVASLVVSSKFMDSKYGYEICQKLSSEVRVLDIVDFGDGQVFPGKTTYTAVITFIKLPPTGSFTVHQFPPGLKWDKEGTYLKESRKFELSVTRLNKHPWDFTTGSKQNIINLMQKIDLPKLSDLFPNIVQGIRTGANNVFVLDDINVIKNIENDVLIPFINGENIRSCKVIKPTQYLLWPYKTNEHDKIVLLTEQELANRYPKAWEFLLKNKRELEERNIVDSGLWYGFSRSQNLDLSKYPKILVREMLPYSSFAADENGEYIFSSGYALIAPPNMSKRELRMWAAVLSTPTMEFQFRFMCTQLHSGWFRILKQHLKRIRVVNFNNSERSRVEEITDKLHLEPDNQSLWEELDSIVAKSFNLTEDLRKVIKEYLVEVHAVSCPKQEITDRLESTLPIETIRKEIDATAYPELTEEQRKRYYPVELAQYNKFHRNREDLGKLVTFVKNKKEKPIHRWYSYTQGFSEELVKVLLEELEATPSSNVYDPFLGSGTTLLTCKTMGINSFGSDVSPLMTWLTTQKVREWNTEEIRSIIRVFNDTDFIPPADYNNLLFIDYLRKAFASGILEQIIGWRNWIRELNVEKHSKDFLLLGLVSILEEISKIRKHGSHYRFMDNTDSVGLTKLNIKVIESNADIKPILMNKLQNMLDDIESVNFQTPLAKCHAYTLDSRKGYPPGKKADLVITSPPYLNRNNYFSQQKAELSVLGLLTDISEYKQLVDSSFRSHVEGELGKEAVSLVPEVNEIINAIELTENNNPKIPHMVAGYFDDLYYTLENLTKVMKKGGKLAFVVGNVRWGGVVVPVDHLLALIGERLGYKLEKIYVTRFKGNSPQQMKRYGKIPVRESIVILSYQ